MLIGYVSDERFVALPSVDVEFVQDGATQAVTRSSARGAVHADLDHGSYEVVLQRDGYGGKRVEVEVGGDADPHQFRLLSDRLLGYVTPLWSRSGDVASYRVHSEQEVRVSLWRYGEQKERVRVLDWHGEHGPEEQRQVLPDGDFTRTGVGWKDKLPGSPGVHDSDRIEAPERSGLYFFHLRSKRDREFFSFPWIVAPAEPASDVAVLASTMTWNAYNKFGGRSNYIRPAGLPDAPVVHGLEELDRFSPEVEAVHETWGHDNDDYLPLSFERPVPFNHVPADTELTDPIEGRYEAYGAGAEWRLLGWLEREGFDYDLYAENQLHDGDLDLAAYEVLVSHTHPEYWSRRMYDRVKTWVFEEGGKLAYLGGNGIGAEVEVIDESTMRVLTEYPDEVDPADESGESYESRFHRTAEPSSELLGVMTTFTGIMTAAPYEVRDPDHWIFEGTGLEAGDTFGETALEERCHGGASGCETDKVTRFAPEGTRLLAKGTNPDDGGAEMVYYETDGGGATFSVGSITYTSALPVDEQVSTVTRNVLERFVGDA